MNVPLKLGHLIIMRLLHLFPSLFEKRLELSHFLSHTHTRTHTHAPAKQNEMQLSPCA